MDPDIDKEFDRLYKASMLAHLEGYANFKPRKFKRSLNDAELLKEQPWLSMDCGRDHDSSSVTNTTASTSGGIGENSSMNLSTFSAIAKEHIDVPSNNEKTESQCRTIIDLTCEPCTADMGRVDDPPHTTSQKIMSPESLVPTAGKTVETMQNTCVERLEPGSSVETGYDSDSSVKSGISPIPKFRNKALSKTRSKKTNLAKKCSGTTSKKKKPSKQVQRNQSAKDCKTSKTAKKVEGTSSKDTKSKAVAAGKPVLHKSGSKGTHSSSKPLTTEKSVTHRTDSKFTRRTSLRNSTEADSSKNSEPSVPNTSELKTVPSAAEPRNCGRILRSNNTSSVAGITPIQHVRGTKVCGTSAKEATEMEQSEPTVPKTSEVKTVPSAAEPRNCGHILRCNNTRNVATPTPIGGKKAGAASAKEATEITQSKTAKRKNPSTSSKSSTDGKNTENSKKKCTRTGTAVASKASKKTALVKANKTSANTENKLAKSKTKVAKISKSKPTPANKTKPTKPSKDKHKSKASAKSEQKQKPSYDASQSENSQPPESDTDEDSIMEVQSDVNQSLCAHALKSLGQLGSRAVQSTPESLGGTNSAPFPAVEHADFDGGFGFMYNFGSRTHAGGVWKSIVDEN